MPAISPSWELWPSFNYLQACFPESPGPPAAWPCPANELSAMGDVAVPTLYQTWDGGLIGGWENKGDLKQPELSGGI